MRYGASGSNPLESLALRLGKVPLPVLDALVPLLKARGLVSAVRFGIFEALAAGSETSVEVARRAGLDAEATELLLRTLAASGYLRHRHDLYRLAPLARRSLLRSSPQPLWAFVLWCGRLWDLLGGLEEMLRRGEGVDLHDRLEDPESWLLYQRAMLEIARFQAAALARHIEVPGGARRLLDIGGSHGLFAAELVRRHRGLGAEVLELPAAIAAARELAREAGIAPLVEHRAGDLREEELGEGRYDLILLANVLHHFRAEESTALLARVRRALVPGGRIAIWEIDVPAAGAPPDLADLAALFFHLTSGASPFRAADCAGWLRAAGFAGIETRRIGSLPGNLLMVARA